MDLQKVWKQDRDKTYKKTTCYGKMTEKHYPTSVAYRISTMKMHNASIINTIKCIVQQM